jgi:alpha-beta hydrolase superfamily lysophospholipase
MLSDNLVKSGIAVLRYDKRAIGRSRLNDPATIPNLVFDDFVDDAARCVDYLHSEGFKKVVVAGHSEGGEIALHLALREDVAVDGLVLLCCPGFPMDQILNAQLSAQLVPQHVGLMVTATTIIKRIKAGESVPVESIPQELLSLFHPSVQPFLCSSMAFDPAELMSRVEQPTLVISGGRDIQVTKENAERLMAGAKCGEHLHFEQMTHILKDADTNDRIQQLVNVYINANLSLTEGLSEAIIKFVKP